MLHRTMENSSQACPETRKVRYGYALLRPDPVVRPRQARHKPDWQQAQAEVIDLSSREQRHPAPVQACRTVLTKDVE